MDYKVIWICFIHCQIISCGRGNQKGEIVLTGVEGCWTEYSSGQQLWERRRECSTLSACLLSRRAEVAWGYCWEKEWKPWLQFENSSAIVLSLFNFYPKVSGCNAEPPNVTLARLTGLKVLEHVSGLWNAAAPPDAYWSLTVIAFQIRDALRMRGSREQQR